MSKRKVDFGALAARQVERNVSAASAAPDRFERAQAVMAGPATSLGVDAIVPRKQSTRELDATHVQSLLESIAVIGLIEPLVVDAKHRLLAGGHRHEAIRILRAERPDVYEQWFASGVPVHTREFDAEVEPGRALEIEVAENEHRKDYNAAQIRELASRLRSAGYKDSVGRPRVGEKALGPALEVIVGKSMKTIRRLLVEREGEGETATPRAIDGLEMLTRAMTKHRESVPALHAERFEDLLRHLREHLLAKESA